MFRLPGRSQIGGTEFRSYNRAPSPAGASSAARNRDSRDRENKPAKTQPGFKESAHQFYHLNCSKPNLKTRPDRQNTGCGVGAKSLNLR